MHIEKILDEFNKSNLSIEDYKKQLKNNFATPSITMKDINVVMDGLVKDAKNSGEELLYQRPKLKTFKQSEISQRKQLSEKTRNILIDKIGEIAKIKSEKSNIIGDDDIRKVEALIKFGGEENKISERENILLSGTKEQKAKLFGEILSKCNNFANKLNNVQNDEELLEVSQKDFNLFFAMSELQFPNNKFVEMFGLDSVEGKKICEKWEKTNETIVDASALVNKLSGIASPYYAEIDLGDASAIGQFINMNAPSSDEVIELVDNFNEDKNFKQFSDSQAVWGSVEASKKRLETRLNGELNKNSLQIYDVDNKITTNIEKSVDNLYAGKSLILRDANGQFKGEFKSVDKTIGQCAVKKDFKDINLEKMSNQELKQQLDKMYAMMDKSNGFFMRWQSKSNYSNIMQSLNTLRNGDLSNKEEVLKSMKDIAGQAKIYLESKSTANRSSNTVEREKSVFQIATCFGNAELGVEKTFNQQKTENSSRVSAKDDKELGNKLNETFAFRPKFEDISKARRNLTPVVNNQKSQTNDTSKKNEFSK